MDTQSGIGISAWGAGVALGGAVAGFGSAAGFGAMGIGGANIAFKALTGGYSRGGTAGSQTTVSGGSAAPTTNPAPGGLDAVSNNDGRVGPQPGDEMKGFPADDVDAPELSPQLAQTRPPRRVRGAPMPGGGGPVLKPSPIRTEHRTPLPRRTPTDGYKEQLFERPGKAKSQTTLDAARRELAGERTGFDHVAKVRNAQRGLMNRIQEILRQLAKVDLQATKRAPLLQELGEASRLLDYSRGFVP